MHSNTLFNKVAVSFILLFLAGYYLWHNIWNVLTFGTSWWAIHFLWPRSKLFTSLQFDRQGNVTFKRRKWLFWTGLVLCFLAIFSWDNCSGGPRIMKQAAMFKLYPTQWALTYRTFIVQILMLCALLSWNSIVQIFRGIFLRLKNRTLNFFHFLDVLLWLLICIKSLYLIKLGMQHKENYLLQCDWSNLEVP